MFQFALQEITITYCIIHILPRFPSDLQYRTSHKSHTIIFYFIKIDNNKKNDIEYIFINIFNLYHKWVNGDKYKISYQIIRTVAILSINFQYFYYDQTLRLPIMLTVVELTYNHWLSNQNIVKFYSHHISTIVIITSAMEYMITLLVLKQLFFVISGGIY